VCLTSTATITGHQAALFDIKSVLFFNLPLVMTIAAEDVATWSGSFKLQNITHF